jgi:chemotaxis protein MotB
MRQKNGGNSESRPTQTDHTAAATTAMPRTEHLYPGWHSIPDLHQLSDIFPDESKGRAAMHWSIPWSDLMMVMFVMFAILFTYKAGDKRQVEVPTPAPTTSHFSTRDPIFREPTFGLVSAQSIYKSSQQVIKAARLDNVEVVLEDDQSVKVSVQGPMFFDLGRADLRPETLSFLDSLAGIIGRTMYRIQVIGHTDDFPIISDEFPTNWELSVMRATKVARYLIEQGGLEPGRFTVSGRSMFDPDFPNSSVENKAKNRRVEIIITRDIYQAQGQGETHEQE